MVMLTTLKNYNFDCHKQVLAQKHGRLIISVGAIFIHTLPWPPWLLTLINSVV